MEHEWLRRQIIENNRIDILAGAILGLEVQQFHLALMQFQFQHPSTLQLVFRGAGKSTTCTITKCVHLLLKNPNLRILIASKTAANAEGFLRGVKNHFEGNDLLAEVFGEYYNARKVEKWDNKEITVLPRNSPEKEASITCIGADGTIVSKHYDVIISDDLVDEDNSRTKHQRDKLRTWYYKVLDPTLEPPTPDVPHRGEHHHLGTRYHYDDQWGHLMANELKDATQIIPALNEKGQSPWPARFPPAWFIDKRKKSGVIIFNSQYQCHSEQTEFLTEDGWKLVDDVCESRLATVNVETKQLEYQKPTGRTKLPFDGEMLRIRSNTLNALVTPNHRMLARPAGWAKRRSPPQGKWDFVEAQGLEGIVKDRALLYSGALWEGREASAFTIPEGIGGRPDGRGGVRAHHPEKVVPMDVFLRFLGYFIAEGSTTAKGRGGVRLDQNEGETLEAMKACYREMGLSFTNNGDTCRSLDVRHIGLWKWLRENVKTNSKDARIPRFAFKLSARQLWILFNAMIEGDGHVVRNAKSTSYQYTTVSRQLADDVQELATMLRMDASLIEELCGAFSICARKSIGNGVKAGQVMPERYAGNVVCFQVPNSTLITRLGGKVLVSGNCDTEAMKGEIFQYDDCQRLNLEDFPDIKSLRIFMGVDLAISENEAADKFAICVIGVTPDKSGYYVLDYFEDQLRFNAQTAKILDFARRWDPIRIAIETNQYQEAQYQQLKDLSKENPDMPELRLRSIKTIKDKITRAWKLSALFEDKRIYFKKGAHDQLIEHLVLFPNHKYRDLFDALDLAVGASKVGRKRKKREHEPGLL